MKGLSDKGLLRVAKSMRMSDKIPGGKADGKKPSDFDPGQMEKGLPIEMEHTDDPELAKEITMDHLTEFDEYYDGLIDMEDKLKQKSKKSYLDYPMGTTYESASEVRSAVRRFSDDMFAVKSSYPEEWTYLREDVLPLLQDLAIQARQGAEEADPSELASVYAGLQEVLSSVENDPTMYRSCVNNLEPALTQLQSWVDSSNAARSARKASAPYPQGDYPLGVDKKDIALQPRASEDQEFLDEEMGAQGIRNALLRRFAGPSLDWYSEWERQKEEREDALMPSSPPGSPKGPEVLDEEWDVEVDIERGPLDEDEYEEGHRSEPDNLGDGSEVWWPYTGDDDEADGEPGK